jgi:DNA adenine methylase
LLEASACYKKRGVYVALSIDGAKYSEKKICNISIPDGLFENEISVVVGRSMMKLFHMDGKTLEEPHVTDRLLITY